MSLDTLIMVIEEQFLIKLTWDLKQTTAHTDDSLGITVELHVHLDGSVRVPTIWEIAQRKGFDLKCKTLEDLFDACCIKSPSTLEKFLVPFHTFLPVIVGDAEAIERIAYEYCEDAAHQNVLYAEVRFVPHLLSSTHSPERSKQSPLTVENSMKEVVTPRDVVVLIQKGLERGMKKFNLIVRTILCCFRGRPEWSSGILDLCCEFREQGVVGIDVAGDEATGLAAKEIVEIFKIAAKLGIHRTAHAGEAGPASNVQIALDEMHAERIGHGYHVVDDSELFKRCLKERVHFEACPYSSCLTGSVPLTDIKHPIVKYAEDGANFSISRDDPTITQKSLDQEYEFLRGFGLKDVHLTRANFNAAQSCFLPETEKKQLLQKLAEVYGFPDCISECGNS